MEYYELLTTNLSLQFALTETQFLGDNRQSFEQYRLILTRTLLCLLDQAQTPLTGKQFETLFFNLIKAFSHQSYQVQAAALQCVSAISTLVPASFFATRSITTVYEKFANMRPQCLRLLGKVANSASLGDIQRLIKQALADKNERLVMAALVAARRNNVIVQVDASKVVGCAGYLCGLTQELDKLIASKTPNQYCQLAILQRVSEMEDERKRMYAILQFVPNEARDLRQEYFFVYLEALKQLNELRFSTLKANLHTVLLTFIMILQAARSDIQKIAVLRQVLKIYAQCPKQGDLFSYISEALKKAAGSAANISISALALTALVAASPDYQSVGRLMQILPNLTGGIKHDALGTLVSLTNTSEMHYFSLATATSLLKSVDGPTRSCGFYILLALIAKKTELAEQVAKVLLDEIEGCEDSMQCRQACEALCETQCDQAYLVSVLMQKAVLGSDEVKSAAFNGLKQVYQRARSQDDRLLRCASLAMRALETDDFDDFDVEEPEMYRFSEQFEADDFIIQQELLLSGNFEKIQFGVAAKARLSKKGEQKQVDSELTALIAPGYEEMFTRGEFEHASSQTLDVSVSLCKVFLTRNGQKQLQLIYKVIPDDGLEIEDVEIRIGKIKSTKIDKRHYFLLVQYSSLDEIRQFGNIKMKYRANDEDETVKLFDVTVSSYDLIQAVEIENYQQIYYDGCESTEELIVHLYDIPDVSTALENIPSFCGLLNVEIVNETYKKATFFMTGKLSGVGDIVCKADIKISKFGVKAKIHCVGPATEQLYSIFE